MTDTPTNVPAFSTASAAWFEDHKRYIKPSTADSYGGALKPLTSFFGDKPINEIGSVHLRMYQGLRSAKVCANTINREVGVLQQVLREFDEWKRLESHYKQLKEPPRRAGRSLTTRGRAAPQRGGVQQAQMASGWSLHDGDAFDRHGFRRTATSYGAAT